MQIHELQRKHKNKGKKRVGRGGKKGTYSGKGNKGQKSRAGRKMVPLIRELIKRYPKLKGYKTFRFDEDTAIVNLDVLEKMSKDGETINPENLIVKGMIGKIKGKTPKVKILGTGKLTKKLVVENCKTSKTAMDAIVKAGGTIK
jgi:large subunit ribosomal protein L15